MANWYIIYNGQQVGPMARENIRAYRPTPQTLVWREGMTEWKPLYTVPELRDILGGLPPNPPGYAKAGTNALAGKDKTTAGILALVIGGLGIHYFYLNKPVAGLITILLSFVTCGIWPVIMLIQGILMLTMTDAEFYQKYVNTDKTFPLF